MTKVAAKLVDSLDEGLVVSATALTGRVMSEIPAPQAPPSAADGDKLILDSVAILNRCGGDQDLLATLAQMFPVESSKLLSALERAREESDYKGVQLNAHTLKGMFSMFGAAEAVRLSSELETAASSQSLGTEEQIQAMRGEVLRAQEAVAELLMLTQS